MDEEKRITVELTMAQINQLNNPIAQRRRNNLQQFEIQTAAAKKMYLDTLAAIQQSCPHLVASYCGDPAGGSDSSNSCNACGKEIR